MHNIVLQMQEVKQSRSKIIKQIKELNNQHVNFVQDVESQLNKQHPC